MNNLLNFLGGTFFGGLLVLVTLDLVSSSYHKQGYDAVAECQRTLPRNQTCKIIAVPRPVEEKK